MKFEAVVIKIVDGDTLDLFIDLGFDIWIKERVRLAGIDTPETRTRNKIEKKAGLAAKQFVMDAIGDEDKIVIEVTKEGKGKFGRYLVIIYYTDHKKDIIVNLNQELIDLGHAVHYFGGKKRKFNK